MTQTAPIPAVPVNTPPPRPPPRQRWFGGNMAVARFGLILNLLVPLALLIWDASHHKLGADPVNYAIHTTGLLAVTFLLLSLFVTPVRMITGFTWIVQFRRSLGVYAFYYGCAHLGIYFWWDRQGSLSATAYEIAHRFYLAIGFAALCLMAPLWATSFNRAIQWLGGTWWKRLHRLAYFAAALACWHFYLQVKADKRLPDVYIAVLSGLLLWRVVAAVTNRTSKPRQVAEPISPGKMRFWRGQLHVIGMFRETPTVRTFRLAPANGGPLPFTFRAGQFLSLSLIIDGKKAGRSYTIASPPTRDAYLELTIKREDQGHVSRFLHDMLATGQSVTVSAPAGRFVFDPSSNEKGIVLIAGGVGITPVMSILRDLTDRCWSGKIDLVFSVRTTLEVIFSDELRLLQGRHPNLRVHITVTRDAPDDWHGERGRITAPMLQRLIPDVAQRPAFVCGPDAMAAATRQQLLTAGVPPQRILLESFTPGAAVAKDVGFEPNAEMADRAAVTVTFERSNQKANLSPRKTILEAAESVGVNIDNQCRSGICGTCRTRLLSGRVTMQTRDALSAADEADGYFLPCQAHATEDVTVEA